MEIQSLTVSERILLAEALWDSVASEDTDIELTGKQKEELNQRLEAYAVDHESGLSWDDVKARILHKK